MNCDPVLINSPDDDGRKLLRIEAKPGDPKDENWLQELLFRHPDLLPVDEFDDMFAPAVPIGREVRSGRGPIDNLYISPTGGITIVETKLWKNPEKHRTVVAQIIDYAKELAKWTYDDLAKAVLTASRTRDETQNSSLEEKVAASLKQFSVTPLDFQEGVQENLKHGNFLLLIVGDRIAPNVALLTEAIHTVPGLGFQLGLVEIRLHPLDAEKEWPLIVVPDVVGRTVEKLRGIVRVRYKQEKPVVFVDIEDEVDADEILTQSIFLEKVTAEKGTEAAQVASRIIAWAGEHTPSEPKWGTTGIGVGFGYKNFRQVLFRVWESGTVSIALHRLKGRPPFDDEEKRRELVQRLNAIDGIDIPADKIEGEPSVDLNNLKDDNALQHFFEVMTWVMGEITAAAG